MIIHRKQGQKRENRRTKKPSTLLGLGITWSIFTFVNAPRRSTDSCYGIQMAHLNTLPFPLIGLTCTCDSVLASERQEKSIGSCLEKISLLDKKTKPLKGKAFSLLSSPYKNEGDNLLTHPGWHSCLHQCELPPSRLALKGSYTL